MKLRKLRRLISGDSPGASISKIVTGRVDAEKLEVPLLVAGRVPSNRRAQSSFAAEHCIDYRATEGICAKNRIQAPLAEPLTVGSEMTLTLRWEQRLSGGMKTLLLTVSLAIAGVSTSQAEYYRPSIVRETTVLGAVAGALIGGHNNDHWVQGAVIGAAAGAIVGVAIDNSHPGYHGREIQPYYPPVVSHGPRVVYVDPYPRYVVRRPIVRHGHHHHHHHGRGHGHYRHGHNDHRRDHHADRHGWR
jgi:hypothetical protein